jgi:hypothetical protein
MEIYQRYGNFAEKMSVLIFESTSGVKMDRSEIGLSIRILKA